MFGWNTTEEQIFLSESTVAPYDLIDDVVDIKNEESYFEELPIEILEHIFAHLDLLHVFRIARTKKIFKEICYSKEIWLSLFKQRFNSVRDKNFLESNTDPIDYKDVLLSYEHCFIEATELIDGFKATPTEEDFNSVKSLIQKYPGIAVRILVDLEVHHFFFSKLRQNLDMSFNLIELLIADDRNKIIMENYGLMKFLYDYQAFPGLEPSTQNRAVNAMLDLPLRDLNDHHGDSCSICLKSPMIGALLYASESSNFMKKFCGECYFQAPKEEYIVLRANNFLKHPTTGFRQMTNYPMTKVHYTHCSNCEAYPIYQTVYRCLICSQYKRHCDLCAHCRALHPQNHTFLELRKKRDNYYSASRSELLQADLISTDVDYNYNEEYIQDWMIPPYETNICDDKPWIGFIVRQTRLVKCNASVDLRSRTVLLQWEGFKSTFSLDHQWVWMAHDGIRGCFITTSCFHIWPETEYPDEEPIV